MSTTMLVTGGTGTLGRLVVARLLATGAEVRVLTRREDAEVAGARCVTGDLATGAGVQAAVAGVRTVVHCAGGPRGDEQLAQSLVRAASSAGVTHLVNISVVGADRVPVVSRVDRAMFGYFAAKLAAERVLTASGLPWTTLRATQFHDLVLTTAQALGRLPVVPAFDLSFQPIDADEVALRLSELAFGGPAGLVAEMGGPQTYRMTDLVRDYLRAAGRRRPVVTLRPPGDAARALRDGANLVPSEVSAGPGVAGRRTWEEFLSDRVGQPDR